MPDNEHLRVEKLVANAHLRLVAAALTAEGWSDQGFSDDLRQFCIELERMQVALLKGRPRGRAGRNL